MQAGLSKNDRFPSLFTRRSKSPADKILFE